MNIYVRAAGALALVFSWTCVAAQEVPAECADMVAKIGVPKYKGDVPPYKVLCRLGYVLVHNHDNRTPDWVVERLTPDRFTGPGDRDELNNPFKADPDLDASQRAELEDYKKKSKKYDRGHMAPAATMRFSEDATIESFYLSNMAPQVGIGLNRHIWANLEGFTRDWACERGEVIVITGPIYEDDRLGKTGNVAIPTGFYKIAYDPKKKRAIAFVLPNAKVPLQGRRPEAVLADHIKTVTEVEELTGLRFLDKIPARDRRRIEGLKSAMWSTKKKCPKDDS